MTLLHSNVLTIGIFCTLGLLHQVTTYPVVVQNSNPLSQLTSDLEKLREGPIFRDDDDEDSTPRNFIAPGVFNILFGVVTGDLRRVLEEGAFSFINKESREKVLQIYHNLLGRTTTGTTTLATTTRRRRSTTTESDTDVEETEPPEVKGSTKKPVIKYKRPGGTSGQVLSKQKSVSSTTKKSTVEPDEDDLVAKFEQVLSPLILPHDSDSIMEAVLSVQ